MPKPSPSPSSANPISPDSSPIGKLLDIDVLLHGNVEPLSSVLRSRIIENYKPETEASLRRSPTRKPLSALLFGPPGTSKTEIAKAIAEELRWPRIEITPSDFVRGNLNNIYLQADEIFNDLMDLSGVVVFFDEMDALVQTREGDFQLDITSQFLTTMMLPKLTALHDQGRVVFLMATNFQERFDAAIKRAGRFDLLLCMGPPTLDQKLNRLHVLYQLPAATDQTRLAGSLLRTYIATAPDLGDQLELYTFGECKAFFKAIGNENVIGDAINTLQLGGFRSRLTENSAYVILKMADVQDLRKKRVVRGKTLATLKREKFSLRDVIEKKIPVSHIARYLVDWQESKEQH
jgi:hypothetical protein